MRVRACACACVRSNAVRVDVGHIFWMAVARGADAALAQGAGEHDDGPGVVDGDVHRDRQPHAAAAHRPSDGRTRAPDVPDGVRAAGAGRLGADPVHQGRVVLVCGPRAPRLRHGHRVHRVAGLPGRDSGRGRARLARPVLPEHELVRHTARVRGRLDGVVRHAGGRHERGNVY